MDWFVKSVSDVAKAVESNLERLDAGVRLIVSSTSVSESSTSSASESSIMNVVADSKEITGAERQHRLTSEQLKVTPNVLEFANTLSSRSENFTEIDLDPNANVFLLNEAEQQHATAILNKSKQLANLRYKLTPLTMSDNKFWAVYFQHLENFLHSTDFEEIHKLSSSVSQRQRKQENESEAEEKDVEPSEIPSHSVSRKQGSEQRFRSPKASKSSSSSPSTSSLPTLSSSRTTSISRVAPLGSPKSLQPSQNVDLNDPILKDFYQVSSTDWHDDTSDDLFRDYVEIHTPHILALTTTSRG